MHVSDRFWAEADDDYDEDTHASGCDEDGKKPLPARAECDSSDNHGDAEKLQNGVRSWPIQAGADDELTLHVGGPEDLGNKAFPDPDEFQRSAAEETKLAVKMICFCHGVGVVVV
jgi:hypothetical protein